VCRVTSGAKSPFSIGSYAEQENHCTTSDNDPPHSMSSFGNPAPLIVCALAIVPATATPREAPTCLLVESHSSSSKTKPALWAFQKQQYLQSAHSYSVV